MMTEEERNALTEEYRKLVHFDETAEYQTDQELHRTQPPLFKAPMSDEITKLPINFEGLPMESDFRKILYNRKSSRVFAKRPISLLELSFLLYAAAGVKEIRGKAYATIRTAPSGGARHAFEVYVAALRVDGLPSGIYHYQAKNHTLELLRQSELSSSFLKELEDAVCGQIWCTKAGAILFYSYVPYRAEWRYSYDAHRVAMMDAGHTMENVYLAASALHLGACANAAVSSRIADPMFGIDGEEEFSLCCVPVGKIEPGHEAEENEFYAFLKTEEEFYH